MPCELSEIRALLPRLTERIDPEQIEFLNKQNIEIFKEEPKLIELQEKLLKIGGTSVVFPRIEEDLDKILKQGKQWKLRVKRMPGAPSRCHQNAANCWDANRDRSEIVTGYALTKEDGLWRQHSWVHDKKTDTIVETTEPRAAYFGFTLDDREANEFYYDNAL